MKGTLPKGGPPSEIKKYEIFQVDAFTRELFTGNPAGVVPDADGLTDEQMQNIAAELNNSETAFILSPTSDDLDFRSSAGLTRPISDTRPYCYCKRYVS